MGLFPYFTIQSPPVPSQVEGLLSEWVRHYHVPGRTWDADKIYAAYVARVGGWGRGHGLLGGGAIGC